MSKLPIVERLELPTEEMWGGLARAIMLAWDLGAMTPRALFKHLENCGETIPQWLRDEPEMKALDHVPSKGTRCVIIWRAMFEASQAATTITDLVSALREAGEILDFLVSEPGTLSSVGMYSICVSEQAVVDGQAAVARIDTALSNARGDAK